MIEERPAAPRGAAESRDAEERAWAGVGRAPRRLARRASERIPPRAELMEQAAEASRAVREATSRRVGEAP